jgi:Flp pilus assembly protein TadG
MSESAMEREMNGLRRLIRRWRNESEGSSFVEIAIVLPLFLLMVVPAVDVGRLLYAAIEVESASEAGAMYGVKNPGDVAGMQTASLSGASNLAGVSATATYGCECSDGSGVVANCSTTPTCTYNYVNYVDVVATAPYVTMFRYPGLPSSMNISRKTRMRVGGD